jgi:SsrA-binding protein
MAKIDKKDIQKSVNIQNRKASHEYHFIETFIAGMVLKGTEIKSIRMGRVNMQDAYCLFIKGECWVRGLHISPYEMGGYANHEAKAERKLMLSKRELRKLESKLKESGLTLVPTRMFINDRGWAKLQIALAKGKKLYDKRDDLKDRDMRRDMERRDD